MASRSDFLSFSEICPSIIIAGSYATIENFTGEVVRGYKTKKVLLAKAPAEALCLVQREALSMGLTLKIFDGYRPAKAVAFFQEWALRPETSPELKKRYYPTFERKDLFERGYIARRSTHSRGSAVDLTLVEASSGIDLDMGSGFDYFDSLSNTDSPLINEVQRKGRQLLKRLMEGGGFENFDQEWWHQ